MVGVCEGVAVAVAVGVLVAVNVAVAVGVFVRVAVLVGVAVFVAVAVVVEVPVGVFVAVAEGVAVLVALGLGVDVFVKAGLDVAVCAGGKYTSVLVGVLDRALVLTTETRVDVGGGTGVSVMRIRVGAEAPGVRKTLIQTGWVRMAGSIASTNPFGRFVR